MDIQKKFSVWKRFQANLSLKRKMKILFSDKQDWKPFIQNSFQYSRHEITFEKFSPDNIKENDLVVPLTIQDLMYLNEVRHLIVDNPIPIPSKESILLCNDKYRFNQTLIESGFRTLIPKMGDTLTYPYILKKKIDQFGQNTHIISGVQQEKSFADILADPEYFTQEIIPGTYEYATHILFKNHEILCSLNIEYSFESEMPIKGKDKPIYKKKCHFPYADVLSSVIRSIGFEGLCCVNYKVHDNQPLIIEINPRCGGSLCSHLLSFVECVA